MKKLLGLALACALLLTGCGARGGDKGEELGDNTIRPLELTEEEEALLKLVGGSDAEYGLFECAAGEGVSDCTVEVLSWEDGAWQTVAEGACPSAPPGRGGWGSSSAGIRSPQMSRTVAPNTATPPGWTGWTAAWRQAGPRSGWRKIRP